MTNNIISNWNNYILHTIYILYYKYIRDPKSVPRFLILNRIYTLPVVWSSSIDLLEITMNNWSYILLPLKLTIKISNVHTVTVSPRQIHTKKTVFNLTFWNFARLSNFIFCSLICTRIWWASPDAEYFSVGGKNAGYARGPLL